MSQENGSDPERFSSFILFCSTISIRGFNKIVRGPRPLRALWLFFVIVMSSILLISSSLLVRDFMLYDVNINIKVEIDSKTLFPALTVCHHHPFSSKGYELWKNKTVMSPSDFNQKLRNLTLHYLLSNNMNLAEILSYLDGISVYYQNLPYAHATKVGHSSEIFLSCMYLISNQIIFADNCSMLDNYKIQLVSHHEYFNCYTFEPTDKETSSELSMLGLIVSLGPKPDYLHTEQAFIIDTFRQAKGLKVVVHESGTLPDIDDGGIHIEPGKMNEISYRPVQWELANTPSKPCIENSEDTIFNDLKNKYIYTQHLCLKEAQQEEAISQCKCMFIYNPRPKIPDKSLPYCGTILPNFSEARLKFNLECLQNITDDKAKAKRLEKEKCFQRCRYTTYESSISVTKWRATEFHLHWLRQQLNAINGMKQFMETNQDRNISESKHFQQWLEYGRKKNLTKINLEMKDRFLEGDNFAYLVLRRESRDSVKKYERLVITQYVLVSRIGGLCSLTVGITMAFIVELVEFCYLFKSKMKKLNQKKTKKPILMASSTDEENRLPSSDADSPDKKPEYHSNNFKLRADRSRRANVET